MSDEGPSRDRDAPERVHLEDEHASPDGPLGWLRWLLTTDQPTVQFAREVTGSVLTVLLVGVLLFAVSGIWPPLVAVESSSMVPHMHRGDLVFVVEEHRLSPSYATGSTGVVTYRTAKQRDAHRKFGDYGDVIVYQPNGEPTTPIIHRARFWVTGGENWVHEANPAYLPTTDCGPLPNCPAPHAGFITKGDANPVYDQVAGGTGTHSAISSPVRPSWIRGTAEVRIPWLGYIRLYFSSLWVGFASPGAPAVGIGTMAG